MSEKKDDAVEMGFQGHHPLDTIFGIIFALFDNIFPVIKSPAFSRTVVYALIEGDKEMEAEIEKYLNAADGKWRSFVDGKKTKEKLSFDAFIKDDGKDILTIFRFDENGKATGFSCIIFKCKAKDFELGDDPGQLLIANRKFIGNVMTFFNHYFDLPIKDALIYENVFEGIYWNLKETLVKEGVFESIKKERVT